MWGSFFKISVFLTLLHDKEGEEEALQKLSEIKVPIQVIWGKHDEVRLLLVWVTNDLSDPIVIFLLSPAEGIWFKFPPVT